MRQFTSRSLRVILAGVTLVGLGQLHASGAATAGQQAAWSDASPATSTATGSAALVTALNTILDSKQLAGATVSVIVRDARTGVTLYQRDPDTRLNPASNAKIFTSLAAMGTLGPKWRFHTDVLATGHVRRGTLESNLYLRGGGDPTLLQRDCARLAQDLARDGVRRVRGSLVADDHYFDRRPFGAGWAWDDTPYYYSAVTSGLTLAPNTDYDSGTVIVQARPGQHVGDQVRLRLRPATGVLRLVNHATTAPAGSPDTVQVNRRYGTNVVRISGRMPLAGGLDQSWVPVPSPTAYVTDVFARALRAQGITVMGGTVTGRTPGNAHVLAGHRSITVAQLLTPFLKLSNNMHAEALTKTMGKVEQGRGSWGPGTAVIRQYARSLGIDTSALRLWDGSGLSRFDLISARSISDALIAARAQPWFRTWYDALPIACNKNRMVGGTLSYRMCGTPAANNLHAKTGSLAAVSALSGYVTDQAGTPLVFSMLSSNFLRGDPETLEDAVGVTLASWNSQKGTLDQVSRPSLRRTPRSSGHDLECSWAKNC